MVCLMSETFIPVKYIGLVSHTRALQPAPDSQLFPLAIFCYQA